jgi:hypothetical protein
VALESHHLKLSTDRAGDVDLLIACGWVRDGLGATLYRLRAEFDAAKGEDRIAGAYLISLRERAIRATLASADAATAAAAAETKTLHDQIDRETLTLRALVLLKLKSLDGATKAMRHYAEQSAARRGCCLEMARLYSLSGQVLQILLDPLCPKCEGRGFWGGYGGPLVWHQGPGSCERSGRRRVQLGQSMEEEAFGRWMLSDLERKMARVDQLMRKFLRASSYEAPGARVESEARLRRRLSELRSADAQLD